MFSQKEKFEFSDLISVLNLYKPNSLKQLENFAQNRYRTPEEIEEIRQAINSNAELFEHMAQQAPFAFGGNKGGNGDDNKNNGIGLPFQTRRDDQFDTMDLHQLTAALKSAARDWTSLGETERHQTYGPIIDTLKEFLPKNSEVLVPGAGLCRLACEIASSGFVAFANENSFIMIVISQIAFLHKKQFRIFPFLHQVSGLENFKDTLISDTFPNYQTLDPLPCDPDGDHNFDNDLKQDDDDNENSFKENITLFEPAQLIDNERLVLMAGDIIGLENAQAGMFDAVVTCFFIDVVSDIEQIISLFYKILKPNGYWINLGPLMMHRADNDFFAKYTFYDIPRIAQKKGFKIIRESRIDTSYIENPHTNVKTLYKCQFLVTQK